ncbi:MAG: hypothetical protein ACKVX7_12900 [Planctomycetota bacterium]
MSTESGWVQGVEVVRLEFDPRVISYQQLAERARAWTTHAFPVTDAQVAAARAHYGDQAARPTADVRVVDETKYYLRATPLKHVPMTRTQATRVNADVAAARTNGVLSSSQLALLAFIEQHPTAKWPDVCDQDLQTTWPQVEALRREIERRAAPPSRPK